MKREIELAAAFTELSAALVTEPDAGEILHRLAATASSGSTSTRRVSCWPTRTVDSARSRPDERTELLEMLALQHQEGPCLDLFHGQTSVQTSLAVTAERWPTFTDRAVQSGYSWVCGVPMRSGLETLGAVNLFRSADRPLLVDQARLAQAFADVATAGLLQRRETEAARRLAAQLQTALDSRRLIEQAKGVLAERLGIGPEAAFQHLRRRARDGNRKIHELASAVIDEADRTR